MKQVPIVMPQMGQSVAEGTIVRWHKSVGDDVAADELLLEVETDKANVDIESPASGKLVSCLKDAGEVAAAGEVIGAIEPEEETADLDVLPGEEASAEKPHAGGEDDAVTVSAQNLPRPALAGADLPEIDRNQFSPYVLRLAMLNNVMFRELQAIKGTGRSGRVTKYDVLQYLAHRPVGAATVEAMTGKIDLSEDDLTSLGEIIPMTSIRRTIADHMVQSIHTSAHVTMVHAVDMTHIVKLRNRVKDAFEKQVGARMSYTAVMLFVTSRVLRNFPMINAMVHGTNIILRKPINIGCAVALADESLVVPVVKNADQKSFPDIAKEVAELIRLARERSLKRQHVEGGTFTISNFGSFGSVWGTPIISQPQVAILGMGAVSKAAVVINGGTEIRDQLYLSFSFDHRVIDGAMGGRFLQTIQEDTEALNEETLEIKHI